MGGGRRRVLAPRSKEDRVSDCLGAARAALTTAHLGGWHQAPFGGGREEILVEDLKVA